MDKQQCEKLLIEKAKEIYAIYREYNPDDFGIFIDVCICDNRRSNEVSISLLDSMLMDDRISVDCEYDMKEASGWQKDSVLTELSAKLEAPTFAMFAASLSPKARKRIMRRERMQADTSADGII